MATQTVEFKAPPGQTVTAKLFGVGSDTPVQSVSAIEATNRKGTYTAAFADAAAADYEVIAFVGSTKVADWFVTLTATTATFYAREKVTAVLDPAVRVKLDATQPDCNVLRTGVEYQHTQIAAGVDTVNVTIEEA